MKKLAILWVRVGSLKKESISISKHSEFFLLLKIEIMNYETSVICNTTQVPAGGALLAGGGPPGGGQGPGEGGGPLHRAPRRPHVRGGQPAAGRGHSGLW